MELSPCTPTVLPAVGALHAGLLWVLQLMWPLRLLVSYPYVLYLITSGSYKFPPQVHILT